MLIHPILASGALQFAFEKATIEGKITIGSLFILSMFSWTIIITKFRQLSIARRAAKKFFAAYGATRDPLDIKHKGESELLGIQYGRRPDPYGWMLPLC